MNKRKKEMIYEGLGFPIRLVNVPMKKVFGEWALDIDFNLLQAIALHMLAIKPTQLTGKEIQFIVDYLELSTREFASLLGVTHPAVLKWIKEERNMNPSTEIYLRLYLLNYLKVSDKEFRKTYLKIKPKDLIPAENEQLLEVDLEKIAC